MQLGDLADGYCRKADETQRRADALRTVLVARPSAPDLGAVADVGHLGEEASVSAEDPPARMRDDG